TWARTDSEKVEVFAKHLANVFQPLASEISYDEENTIKSYLKSPYQMSLPVKQIKLTE
ncbi:hypothetical protein RN001_012546, partial [Aquatica leii]